MPVVREAVAADAHACAAIYAPYVRDTAISFETEPPTAREMAARMAAAHAWLVSEEDGQVLGYAYGGPFKARAAYRWSCEVSVYVDRVKRRSGVGRALYAALFDALSAKGYRTAVAGMTLPNEASAALHEALGFTPVGTYTRIGWKHGAWHDVHWMQRPLGPPDTDDSPPPEPGVTP